MRRSKRCFLRWSDALAKDCRELFGSTAYALLLIVAGPLTGLAFIAAMHAYAEASGAGGGAAALTSALSPLDGMLVPTLGAYDLLITFLVPFVAIRMIAAEKSSGALKLLLQSPLSLAAQLASKVVALFFGWIVCLAPAFLALLMWRMYGGHLDVAETATLLFGHTLRFLLTCALSLAAAAIFDGAASAAIAVLSLTIGTWALDFFAAGRGGWIASLAQFTPTAMLRYFERGLLSFNLVLVTIIVTLLLIAIARTFLDLRESTKQHVRSVAIVLFIAALTTTPRLHRSIDVSEDRRNSFSAADEQLLRSIEQPITIRVHLAAEDPRANDYERNVLTKLRRTLRHLDVEYPYAGQSALFENDANYGTIVYRIGAKEATSRSSTEEIVLDEIETLAGLTPPARGETSYPGYPLRASPRGATWIFYVIWPAIVIATAALQRIRRTG